jgi:hypothetical protein
MLKIKRKLPSKPVTNVYTMPAGPKFRSLLQKFNPFSISSSPVPSRRVCFIEQKSYFRICDLVERVHTKNFRNNRRTSAKNKLSNANDGICLRRLQDFYRCCGCCSFLDLTTKKQKKLFKLHNTSNHKAN